MSNCYFWLLYLVNNFWLDTMFKSEICDLDGIFNSNESEISVQSQKLVIRKNSLNQFTQVGVH